jgi:hypothetical protein
MIFVSYSRTVRYSERSLLSGIEKSTGKASNHHQVKILEQYYISYMDKYTFQIPYKIKFARAPSGTCYSIALSGYSIEF